MDIFATFGISPLKIAIQSLIWLIPAIWATIHVARNRSGASLPLWLILVWIFPLIGAVLALIIVRNPQKQNA
jgi:hypothetical protein